MTDASGWVGAYSMRMARVNITVPDELLDRARAADLNISRVTAAAVAEELDRLTKIYELDRYLAELDVVLAEANRWYERVTVGRASDTTELGKSA
jgi:post-segregation antitoxin (ccd killing protein)